MTAPRHPAPLVASARDASAALARLGDHETRLISRPTRPTTPPPERPPVAKKSVKKTDASAVPGAPDPAVVKQVKDGMMAQLAASPPAGAQAALFDGAGKAKFKKLIDALAPTLVKVALAASDGHISPGEVASLIQDGVALLSKYLAKDGTPPGPAAPTPPAPRVA